MALSGARAASGKVPPPPPKPLSWVQTLEVTHPAFLSIQTLANGNASLVVSQFTGNPFAKDRMSVFPQLAEDLVSKSPAPPRLLTSDLKWPNTAGKVPPNAFSNASGGPLEFNGLVVGGGFLVPPKQVGAVTLLQLDEANQDVAEFTVSTPKGTAGFTGDGYFYHQAEFRDLSGDSRLDILTARANKPSVGASHGQLLALHQPATNPLANASLPWKETVIYEGPGAPDVFFALIDLNDDGFDEIAYASYFSGPGFHVLYTVENGPGRWLNQSNVRRVDVDLSIGTSFGVQVADLNGDGQSDVLVTNHVDQTNLSGVYAYQPPRPAFAGDMAFASPGSWQKRNVSVGFETRIPGPGQASPGKALAFQPTTAAARAGAKPLIVVAGDGEERVYLLRPTSADPSNWAYEREEVVDCGGTTGAMTAGDVNADGVTELYIPCYNDKFIYVYEAGSPGSLSSAVRAS